MSTYICKCGRRVKKSTNADNTGNRLEGYGPGHECYGCPYVLSWGNYEWNEEAKSLEQKAKGYECRMSKTLAYDSRFIGSTKDKCTCSVVSVDFDFLEQISSWVKKTFTSGELTGYFSRGEIRATDYCHNGRYQYTLCCAQNKKGIAAKAALFEHFFNSGGSRKDMTPQQEMEKILADIKKAKEILSCAPAQNADAAVTTAENAVPTATAATPTISESGADASASPHATSLQNCESVSAASAGGSSAPMTSAPNFDFGADEQTNALLLQDAQTFITGNMARIMAAKHAHDLTANHYKGSWGKWCAAVGISRDTGENMVRVAEQFGNIQLEGKSILDVQPLKLLYAAAKPSTPAQVKQAVFSGDITSYKEYQELLAQVREKDAHLEAAYADINSLAEQNIRLKDRATAAEAGKEKALEMQSKAEARAKDAENQLAGSRQVAEAAKLRGDKLKAENDALKHQPITAVVDEEEVDRRAGEKAYQMAADMTAELQAKLNAVTGDAEQDVRNAYDSVLLASRAMLNAWQMVKPQFRKLPEEQREALANQIVHTIGSIQGEVTKCL